MTCRRCARYLPGLVCRDQMEADQKTKTTTTKTQCHPKPLYKKSSKENSPIISSLQVYAGEAFNKTHIVQKVTCSFPISFNSLDGYK